jgi:excisionase family DNA binding protein
MAQGSGATQEANAKQENGRLVEVKEMATILGCHPSWLYEQTRHHPSKIPCVRVGRLVRFEPEIVLAFLREHATATIKL